MNLKQFKLSNDDEIICEVVDVQEAFDEVHNDEGAVVIRKALKIIAQDDFEDNIRYYSFKPMVAFQDQIDEISVLNVGHIITETFPSKTLAIHYARALKEVEASQILKDEMNYAEMLKEVEGLKTEELEDWVKDKLDELEITRQGEEMFDSDSPNVIKFNPKGTMH